MPITLQLFVMIWGSGVCVCVGGGGGNSNVCHLESSDTQNLKPYYSIVEQKFLA